MNQTEVLKPLKTWSHLAARRRKPSEYEVVSVNLHYSTRPGSAATITESSSDSWPRH